MNWLDIVIVGVIVGVVVLEAKRKVLQALPTGICAWVALNYTLGNYKTMAPKLKSILPMLGTESAAFTTLFWGILLAGALGGAFIYFTSRMEPAGAMEPVIGAIFGLVTGAQILRFFFVYQVLFNPTGNFHKVAQGSATFSFVYSLPFLGELADSTQGLRDPSALKGGGGL